MPSTLLKSIILLTFSLLANANRPTVEIADAWELGGVDDWESSGNYRIYSCGSRAPEVKTFLDLTYLWIQNAILSTETPAYKAFFRDADPAPIIKVLNGVAAGLNITTEPNGSERPTLVCANQADAGIRKEWDDCQKNRGKILDQPHNSSVVFLCPHFFDFITASQRQHCGTVNHANTALIPDKHLLGTRYFFLMVMLSGMYIPETLGRESRKPKHMQWEDENTCMALPPDQAIINPQSYAQFTENIRAGCTKFPTKVPIQGSEPTQPDRELIEVDGADGGNGTDAVTFECTNSGGISSSCSG